MQTNYLADEGVMGKLVGYARVSTEEQDIGLQLDALRGAGCREEQIFVDSALAQFERRLIPERTRAGLSAARARGRKGGRKPITGVNPRVKTACRMHRNHELSVEQICKTLDISRATFDRYLALANEPMPAP